MLLEENEIQETEIGADLEYVEEEESGIVRDFDLWYENYLKLLETSNNFNHFDNKEYPIDKEELRQKCVDSNISLFMVRPVAILDHKSIDAKTYKLGESLDFSLVNLEILYNVFKFNSQWNVRGVVK